MLIIRPTQSLAKRMGIKKLLTSDDRSSSCLGDWYSTDVVLNKKQYILSVSGESRLAILMSAAPYADFPMRLPKAISSMLILMGLNPEAVRPEFTESHELKIFKTNNRSAVGTLVDYCKHLSYMVDYGRHELNDEFLLSLNLSGIPSSMTGTWPIDITFKLFGKIAPDKEIMISNYLQSQKKIHLLKNR